MGLHPNGGPTNDKTLTARSTTLALFQIQLNALMLLVDRYVQAGTVREDFQRLVSGGVSQVGHETMKEIKRRIQEGVIQQDLEALAERVSAAQRIRRSVLESPVRIQQPLMDTHEPLIRYSPHMSGYDNSCRYIAAHNPHFEGASPDRAKGRPYTHNTPTDYCFLFP